VTGQERPGPWHGTGPELVIIAVTAVTAALAALAVAGWSGVAVVAVAVAVIALLVLRGLAPPPAGPAVRKAVDKPAARAITGYAQRKFAVTSGIASLSFYQMELRPALEHLLAARLAEHHGINLYAEPARARAAFCRAPADEPLWRWIDPAQAAVPGDRADRGGIPRRTLARLVDRLEQL
jgi:hypothetical protein